MQRYSGLHIKTKKGAKEFDSKNATLLIKAGFIHQTMAGAYTFLPLGLRVLNKIEAIVRDEMNKIASEMLMTSLSPKELWETSKRLETIDVLMKTSGANKASSKKSTNEYILNSTHEELVTPIALENNLSYKDFPFAYYQIQTKFRNEARAKSGLLRGREFRMKDLYSFHRSEEELKEYYEKSKEAYTNVFNRIGIGSETHIALASGGDFTKEYSHEFQTRVATGEDLIFHAKSKGIFYNREVAPSMAPKLNDEGEEILERKDVEGKGIIGVEELAKFLNIPVEKTSKTLIYKTNEGKVIAAVVRGGYEINEEKLVKIIGCESIALADEETVKRVTGAEVGYAGFIDLPAEVEVFFDESVGNRKNIECGANKTNFHSININFGRDYPMPEKFYDFKLPNKGDLYPETGEEYEVFAACEVGNIFPLNTKFSKAFDYYFIDDKGEKQIVYMGCYGIGTSRAMGVVVEKYNDDKGIIWPESIAPYDYHLITLGEEQNQEALELIEKLEAKGKEVLWDDRLDASMGEKLADADLIGIPNRIILTKRSLENGGVEVKKRSEAEGKVIAIEDLEI